MYIYIYIHISTLKFCQVASDLWGTERGEILFLRCLACWTALGRQVGPRARQVGPPRAPLSAKLGHLRAILCSLGGSWTTWPSNLASELPNCSPKAVPSGSKLLPNLEKNMKNAVLSSIFEVRAVLHSKLSWTPLGVLLGANLDVLGVHLAASVTNLGPT